MKETDSAPDDATGEDAKGPVKTGDNALRGRTSRVRILSAAISLFQERGSTNFSLRELTKRADTSLASVNYHFGSKENLYIALLEKAEDELSDALTRVFDQAGTVEGSPETKLRAYLQSFLAPLNGSNPTTQASYLYFSLISKIWAECPEILAANLKSRPGHFTRHADAIKELLPQISEEELHWRLFFVLTIEYGVSTGAMYFLNETEARPTIDHRIALQRVLDFVVPGLLAKSSSGKRQS